MWANQASGWYADHTAILLCTAALLAAFVCGVAALRTARDYRRVAIRLEVHFPELDAKLLTALEQEPELPNGRYGFLQEDVIQQALLHAYVGV